MIIGSGVETVDCWGDPKEVPPKIGLTQETELFFCQKNHHTDILLHTKMAADANEILNEPLNCLTVGNV